MKLKKIMGLGVCVMLAFTSLAGCATATTDNTKKEIITMGTNAAFPPFEFITDKAQGLVGQFSGVDVAIAVEIAKELDKELVISDMEFSAVLAAVPTGKVDFGAAGMTINEERLGSMDFSDPYFTATQYILVKADNGEITSARDLMDKKVGVIEMYTGETICQDMGMQQLSSYKKSTDVVMDLKQGRIDAVVIDSYTAEAFVRQNSDLKVIQDAEAFENESYAIAVKKGNTELLETINKVLERLKSEGKIGAFVTKYTEETEAAQ